MAARLPDTRLADAIGPAGLPRTYAFVLDALSLVLIIRSVGRTRRRGRAASRSGGASLSLPGALGLLGIGVAYVLAIPWLGYTLSIAGLVVATACYQGLRPTPALALAAACGAVAFWLLFVVLLGIPHPPGVWSALF
jgi:hypothetical protein